MENELILDGKHDPKLCVDVWLIKHKQTDATVFEYRTYQGNAKKALFTQHRYAEEALKKYIRNPEDYYILKA